MDDTAEADTLTSDSVTVAEAREQGTLQRVLARLRPAAAATVGPGDDSAVLRLKGDLVVTSDTMIEGSDFRLAWHSGFHLGWKLAATNLSDVAAMGATPIGLTAALACPPSTPVQLLEEISRGLDTACRTLAPGCGVVGGDLSTAPVLVAAVTALGETRGIKPVLRSGARPGDTVVYAGQLGLASIGLALLFREATDSAGEAVAEPLEALWARYPAALGAQFAPKPPIALGRTAAAARASAMMDVSDGLSLDASRLAAESGVVISFESKLLEVGFGEQEGQSVTVEMMLIGGEDHGLLATFPEGAEIPQGFLPVGTVLPKKAGGSGVELDGEPFEPSGWDPFSEPLVHVV